MILCPVGQRTTHRVLRVPWVLWVIWVPWCRFPQSGVKHQWHCTILGLPPHLSYSRSAYPWSKPGISTYGRVSHYHVPISIVMHMKAVITSIVGLPFSRVSHQGTKTFRQQPVVSDLRLHILPGCCSCLRRLRRRHHPPVVDMRDIIIVP